MSGSRRPARPALLACLVLALSASAAVSGCAAAGGSSVTVSGSALTIYVSAPSPAGPQQAAVLKGERLAFADSGPRVGQFALQLRVLGGRISDNARTAIQDPSAIAYLGEVAPGSSADAVGITNARDLLEVSPTDTALELTETTPVIAGAPKKYYESYRAYGQTFARLVPSASVEARAQVGEMQRLGVRRLYVTDDASDYGRALAAAVRAAAPGAGIALTPTPASADGVFDGSRSPAQAQSTFGRAATSSPDVHLFAPSALYDAGFASGLPPQVRRLSVSLPGVSSGTAAALRVFRRRLGTGDYAATAAAIFGYEAMRDVIAALRQAGAQASSRATVVRDFLALRVSDPLLGAYSFGAGGDSTLKGFVFGRLRSGKLVASASGQG